MTSTERQQAILAVIAAKLEAIRAEQGLQKATLARGRLAERTVWAVFKGHDHYVSTLNELADAMGCELVIEIRCVGLSGCCQRAGCSSRVCACGPCGGPGWAFVSHTFPAAEPPRSARSIVRPMSSGSHGDRRGFRANASPS
jgi:hypothetical protein